MPGMKKKAALIEKYGSMTERYKSVAAKKKHERTEPKSQLRKESKAEAAFAARGKSKMKKGVKGGKNIMGTNKAGQRTVAQRG
jgi:hypothetical protein